MHEQRRGQEGSADSQHSGGVGLAQERAHVGGERSPCDADAGADGGEDQRFDHGAESAAGVALGVSVGVRGGRGNGTGGEGQ